MSDDELTLILGRIIAARDHLQPVISAATRYIDHNRAIQDCDWHDGRDVAIHVRVVALLDWLHVGFGPIGCRCREPFGFRFGCCHSP